MLHHTKKPELVNGLLRKRRLASKCTSAQKRLILDEMRDAGSLAYTLHVLHGMHAELSDEVEQLEGRFRQPNHELRLILALLQVRQERVG
jgi:hypothetical protein